MSKSNIARQLAQVQAGTLHAGVDLALENNMVVVITEKAERLDHSVFLKTGAAMITSCGGWKGYVKSIKPRQWWWPWNRRTISGSS
jgi:hypothetical protein